MKFKDLSIVEFKKSIDELLKNTTPSEIIDILESYAKDYEIKEDE